MSPVEIFDATDHAPGDCPEGCDEIRTVERRLDDGSQRMSSIEAELALLNEKLDKHMATSTETNATVTEVLSIIQAAKGFFRVAGWVFEAMKWTAGVVVALGSVWYMIKEHHK